MKRSKRISVAAAAAMTAGSMTSMLFAASPNAYFDDFNNVAALGGGGAGTTVVSTTGSNTYTYTAGVTAGDGGHGVGNTFNGVPADPGILTLTNDATATANANGAIFSSTPTSAYTGFNNTLSLNTGNVLTWTVNMQDVRVAPSGFGSGNYGAAVVLGSTTSSFLGAGAGNGYALIMGNTGSPDPIKLVKFTAGLGTATPVVSGATDSQTGYWSAKVTYDPATNNWTLATRNDGATAFADPTNNTGFISAGNATDTTYTGVSLTYSGAAWAYSTGANQVARFDNFGLNLAPPVVGATPRDLVFDGNAAVAPNPSNNGGAWEGAGNWYNAATTSNVNWDSSTPDNATFGIGSGTGTATVTVGATQTVGKITFAANSPTFTINGPSTINLNGASGVSMVANESATINAPLALGSGGSWTIASGKTLTVGDGTLGGLSLTGSITKEGTGTLVLATPGTNFGGAIVVNAGEVKVNSIDGNGRAGSGTGAITINNGGTFHIDNVHVGQSVPVNTTISLQINNGGILLGTGDALFAGSTAPKIDNAAGTIATIATANISDKFVINSSIRNASTGTVGSKVVVDGPGRVVLASGATSTAPGADQFGGTWELKNGILQIGPVESGGQGEPLNALGYAPADGRDGPTRPILITGGTLASAVNAANPGNAVILSTSMRSPITLAGGTLGTTQLDANYSGDITVQSNSSINTNDAVLGGARTVNLVTQTPIAGSATVNGNMTWGNATLSVTGAGTVNLTRTSGVGAVTAGATLNIGNSAKVILGGTADLLSNGTTTHVNVVNSSSNASGLQVTGAGPNNVGQITGTGNTQVDFGGVLTSTSVRQGTLTVNGTAKMRQAASLFNNTFAPSTSNLTSLVVGGTGQVNLTNTRLITNDPQGVKTGVTYSGILGLVQTGRNGGTWNGPGIITSEPDALLNKTSIGVARATEAKGLTGGATALWSGQTIDANDTLVMYTYAGDANLDGTITADDYASIDLYFLAGGQGTWYRGDFNYDGSITADDYALIDSAFLANSPPLWVKDGPRGISDTVALSAVPEPASLSVLALGAMGMMARRRRAK